MRRVVSGQYFQAGLAAGFSAGLSAGLSENEPDANTLKPCLGLGAGPTVFVVLCAECVGNGFHVS